MVPLPTKALNPPASGVRVFALDDRDADEFAHAIGAELKGPGVLLGDKLEGRPG